MSSIKLLVYDHSTMFTQVKDLFINEYGQEHIGKNGEFFELFYNSEFQKDKYIAIVATDGELIIGFQAFFYWPYLYNGDVVNSFQSGNSLIHPKYRGKGLFGLMLKNIEAIAKLKGIDFLIGFPVRMSFGSFMRSDWENPVNLNWMIKIINPFTLLNGRNIDVTKLDEYDPKLVANGLVSHDSFILANDTDFNIWRNNVRSYRINKVYSYTFYEKGKEIQFELKPNYRGRIKEIVIGKVNTNSNDPTFIKNSFNSLHKILRKANVTIVSYCSNLAHTENLILNTIIKLRYFKIKNEIFFIVKSLGSNHPINDSSKWKLSRADVDTW